MQFTTNGRAGALSDSDIELKRKSPVLEKILRHPAMRLEPEEEKHESYDEARVRSRDSHMLEFRFADGRRSGFSYVGLSETDFEPGGESETITLRFSNANVVVSGQALIELYEKLLDQRARFIQEGSEALKEAQQQDAPFVERIEIERRED
jgi:hypothetical protein